MKRLAAKKSTIDLRDPKVREEFLMSEVMKANQKLAEGKKTRICHTKSSTLNVVTISHDHILVSHDLSSLLQVI